MHLHTGELRLPGVVHSEGRTAGETRPLHYLISVFGPHVFLELVLHSLLQELAPWRVLVNFEMPQGAARDARHGGRGEQPFTDR